MGQKMDVAARGGRFALRVLVSALWAAAGVVAVAAGEPLAVVLVVIYLAYLWVFGGRWLIY
jgi:NADH:ubiquinone oxidoreductase subunit 6 (subunit J)